MSEALFVDTDGVRRWMHVFKALGRSFETVGADLQSTLDGLGECWGDDVSGEEFLKQYADPRDQITSGLVDLGQIVHSTAEGLTTMSVNFQHLEDQNVLSVQHLNPGGGLTPHEPEGRIGKA